MTCSNITNITKKTSYVSSDRNSYVKNSAIKLKIFFKDAAGNLINPTNVSVAITKPDSTVVNIDAGNTINADTGFYYANYTPDASGSYKDVWTATILGEQITLTNNFVVISGGEIQAHQNGLDFNSLILITLSKDIADTNGNKLDVDQYLSFSTEYNPFYCSVEMVKMEMGSWINEVPDDTIALAIHWSSLEADNITGVKPNNDRYFFARSRFTMYDSAIRLFSMPIGGTGGGTGKQKQLGDLLIQSGSSLEFSLKDLVQELKLERDEWWRVINAGGCIVPGQGLGPTSATKGGSIANKINRSREWHDPWHEYYIQPTQNSKYKKRGESKYKSGYTGWNEYYFTSIKKDRR